jgi:hypothetical protein
MATVAQLQAEADRLDSLFLELSLQLEAAIERFGINSAQVNQLQQQRESVVEQQANVVRQLNQARNIGGTASAGQVVAEEARARSDDAAPQNPPSPFVQSNTGLNVLPEDQIETGTDERIRPLNETQATPPAPPQPFSVLDDDGNVLPGTAAQSAGVGARNDDSGVATKNSTRAEIDNVFRQGITPQPNVLDQYASYTYTASVYLMKSEDVKTLINQKKKILPANQLLFQSGGAPTAGRNTYFSNDYYIDKIEIATTITGKGTNMAHNANLIKMTVIEPSGITLLNNLDKAVQGLLGTPQKKKTNFASAIYLLVIRFYGYDDQGNLVRGGIAPPDGSTSGSAFVEKFYPIAINKINFKVANKLVEYEIEATSSNYHIALGSSRGTIPYNVEIGGITVKDALTGPTVVAATRGTTTDGFTNDELNRRARANKVQAEGDEPIPDTLPPAPPNAITAPNPKLTIRQGLMTALNQYQQDLVKNEVYLHADTYSVEFINASLEQAKIQVKNPNKTSGAMPVNGTAADQKNTAKQSYDPTSRVVSVMAGKQIVQVIDQILRNSTYLTDQALVGVGEQTGRQTPNGTPGQNVAWYKISLQATPGKYDTKRNDYAYDIKYIISIYQLSDLVSSYFQVPKYNGVHKQYNYWFTGENTQVLGYEQSYNALYTSVLSGTPGQFASTIVNDAIKANFQPTSGQSNQGAAGRVNEISANAADYLYSRADLATAELQIIGDPAWLQQGEAFATPGKAGFSFNAFLPDGTINFEARQILFEILINTPGDYNADTGIFDPNTRSTVFDSQKRPGATKQSYVYIANTCINEFSKGRFTQKLKGSLLTYLPDQTFKDQQALGRATTATGANAVGNATRTTNNVSATPDNVWTNKDGLYVLTADLPGADTEEDVPIALNSPQPQPPPGPPTSSGNIEGPELLAGGPEPEEGPELLAGGPELGGVNSQSQLLDREA